MSDCEITGALCLLVMLDLKDDTINEDHLLNSNDGYENLAEQVIWKALVLSSNDNFGIDRLVQNTRDGDNKFCEVYTSHPIISSLDEINADKIQFSKSRYDEDTLQYASNMIAKK